MSVLPWLSIQGLLVLPMHWMRPTQLPVPYLTGSRQASNSVLHLVATQLASASPESPVQFVFWQTPTAWYFALPSALPLSRQPPAQARLAPQASWQAKIR